MNQNTIFLEALINSNSKQIEHIYATNFHFVRKFIIQNKGTTEDAEDIFQKGLLEIAVRYKKKNLKLKPLLKAIYLRFVKIFGVES